MDLPEPDGQPQHLGPGQDVLPDGSRIVFQGDLTTPGGDRGVWIAGLAWDGLRPRLV